MTVRQAQGVLAGYVEPGRRDCEAATDEVLAILDDERLVAALAALDGDERAVAEPGTPSTGAKPRWRPSRLRSIR